MCTSDRTTSSRTYLSLEQSFCNGANTLTETAEVAVRAVAAASEAQVTNEIGGRRTERTRPVVAALIHAARIGR